MFKPSLKRSKLEEIQLYTKTYHPPHAQHATVKTLKEVAAEYSSFNVEQNIIFPTSFYQQQPTPKTGPLIFNPLNYEWNDYPAEVKKQIGKEGDAYGVHQIGCYKELLWYYLGNILHLWHKTERKVYKYQMHPDTTCIQIGEIESSSLHFKTRNLYIVAAGVTNQFFLFGLDKTTFAMSDLKFTYQVFNSRYIQKITFVRENQIIVGSDTSNFCHFDFTNETHIACTRLPIFQRAMPYLPLLYPSSNQYIQELLVAQDTIYTLVREEKPVGWITQKARQTLNLLMMKNQEVKEIIERKRIEIHSINRSTKAVQLVQKIKEEELIRKIRAKYPQICENKDNQALRIASIYLSKGDSPGLLSIVTKCGLFVSLNQAETLVLANNLFKAPKENSVGVVGLCLSKREMEEDNYSKDNRVAYSQGLNNLTIMNDSLWYFSEEAMEPVKCDKVEGGEILSLKSISHSKQEWIVFTKAGYYIISRLKIYQIFISYLLVKNELTTKSPQKSWTDEANFELFVQNLSKIIGYEKICESLIDCLLQECKEFKVIQPILQMINDQLRGHSNKNFRDWNYILNRSTPSITLKISEKMGSQLWKCLIEMQGKTPKKEAPSLAAQNINCNAYWYALRNLFVKYSRPLLSVEAKGIKTNLGCIQESIRLLETLVKFFFLKKERETRYFSEAVLNRNSTLKKEKSLPRSPISKLKPITISSEKKEEETSDSTLDQTALAQYHNKFINESSTKLEGIISKSIKKLKTLVTIFLYLADLNETEQVGNIEQILTSRKERVIVRKHLQARVQDQQRLQEFSRVLPELELERALEFNRWHLYQQKYKKPEMANIREIARFISSEDLEKLRKIFQGRYDSFSDLLLLYWDRLYSQMEAINRREYLESKQREIFAAERAFLENETKDYICNEMKAVETEVQSIIISAIKAYIGSNEADYPKAEKIINNIIKIIASHDDKSLISFAENEMANFALAEKLILLRKQKKKTEVALTPNDILARKKFSDGKPKPQRECLSNYDIYLLDSDK